MRKLLFACTLLLIATISSADYINLIQADQCETILEVFIEEDKILVKLEIGEKDYPWFSDIIPIEFFDGGYKEGNTNRRWHHFQKEQFILQSDQGRLYGKVKTIEQRNRIPRASLYTGIPDSSLINKKIVYAEIEYRLHGNISELSMIPPIQDGYLTTMANIGFVVYHKQIPVNDIRYLGSRERLFLNWEDPWYSYFENQNINRHHSSSFMSFLYIDPYEVRHEILGRIKDLEEWIALDYHMDDVIEIHEQDSIKQMVADFLIKRNTVSIDGEERAPIIDRIHFVEVQLSGIQIMEVPKPIPYASAIIGVIFAYPDPGIPQEVTVHWDLFSKKIKKVPTLSTDPAGPWPYDLQPNDSILVWKNFLKKYKLPTISEQRVEHASIELPYLTVVFSIILLFLLYRYGVNVKMLSGRSKILMIACILLGFLAFPFFYEFNIPFLKKKSFSNPEANQLISQLLKNTYRAFDFREESEVYDKLALSNDEELLQRIYLDTRKSMVIENQGGIEAKADEIILSDVQVVGNEDDILNYKCQWIVKGVVGHWGHKHRRENQYEAIISIKPVEGVWKMHNIDFIEEVRLL